MEVNVSTIDDAMFTLNEIKEIEKILIKIRYNVRSDIRRIRLEYMTKLQGINQSGKEKSGLFKRKKSVTKIVQEKKKVIKEKISQLLPTMWLKIL